MESLLFHLDQLLQFEIILVTLLLIFEDLGYRICNGLFGLMHMRI